MKKNLFICVIVIAVTSANAQWVVLPDTNFRNAIKSLVPSAISGNSVDTTNSQITTMQAINIPNWNIYNLTGIQYFDALQNLECNNNHLTSLPLLPPSLRLLNCSFNQLASLPSLPSSLLYLYCYDNQITSFSPLPPLLSEFKCFSNQLTSLPSLPSGLVKLYCGDNTLTSLPPLPSSLIELNCGGSQLTSLPALPSSLKILSCLNNQLSQLPSLPSTLENLNCSGNQLSSLPALFPPLQELRCGINQLPSLPSLPSSMITLECQTNLLTSLPSLPSSLTGLYCSNNQLSLLPTLPSNLKTLFCDRNPLNSLPSLPATITSLNCSTNQLTSLPAIPSSLLSFYCNNNQLVSLPPLSSTLKYLYCYSNLLTSLPSLPSSLTVIWCDTNQITCLPVLPASLISLHGFNAGYSCLPNIPPTLTLSNIHGPSSVCSQNQAIITPSGPTIFCSGGSVTLNASTAVGLTYQWQKDGASVSGATSLSYMAITTGNYTVVETSPSGCTGMSPPVSVTVNSLPSATITPASPTTFCSGGSVVLNAVVAANRTYQWKKGANLISGATSSSYTATTGGNYRVIVTNTVTGCSKTTTSAAVVTVNALPAATITPQGPTTFCAGGNVVLAANTGTGLTYQWKKGSNFISGATLSSYTATTGGNYRVQVTNNNGCSKVSGPVAVSVPCREGEIISSSNNLDFNVYPNPNSGEFTIKLSYKPTSSVQIEMTDELGNVVKRFETSDENVVITESKLAEGIYYLTARNKDEMVIKKISVVK